MILTTESEWRFFFLIAARKRYFSVWASHISWCHILFQHKTHTETLEYLLLLWWPKQQPLLLNCYRFIYKVAAAIALCGDSSFYLRSIPWLLCVVQTQVYCEIETQTNHKCIWLISIVLKLLTCLRLNIMRCDFFSSILLALSKHQLNCMLNNERRLT